MLRLMLAAGALATLGVSACSRSAQSPRPEHSAVAAAMPDAASTPGAQGPATAAPHAAPPPAATLSDTHPEIGQQAPPANAPGGGPNRMAAAGSINQLDRATPDSQSPGKANADRSP